MNIKVTRQDLLEAINTVNETHIVDLQRYIYDLSDTSYAMFKPNPKGLYRPGGLMPVVTPDETYYDERGDIIKYEDIIEHKGSVYNSSKRVVLNKTKYARRLVEDPGIPVNVIFGAHRAVINYITSITLPRYISMISSENKGGYGNKIPKSIRDIIISEESDVEYDLEDTLGYIFDKLIQDVSKFIKNDIWCFYTQELTGTTLVLFKGIDYRIYDWYVMRLADEDEE